MTIQGLNASHATKILMTITLVVSIGAVAGCSISNSSDSISKSISSPSDWSRSSSDSSGSSSGDDGGSAQNEGAAPETRQDAESYAADVAQLAYTFSKQGGDIGALRTGVSGLASKRGITNWEVDSLTCQSIGQGLGQSGMTEEKFTEFSKDLFGDDLTKATELRKGYEKTKPASGSSGAPAQGG